MRTLYNILFATFFWLSAPHYFLKMWRRGNWRRGFGERFGKYETRLKHALTNRQVIWFHAVSVGEVNVCTQLIAALEPRAPNLKIVVSTTTSTGRAELEKKLPGHIEKIYYPIDRRRHVVRAISLLNPLAVVLVEAEIWPNFIWRLDEKRIPWFLVNARLSERSFRGYRRFGRLFRPLFATCAGAGAQNEADAAKLRALGCPPEAVHVVGSLKFDAARVDQRQRLDVAGMLRQLGVAPNARILVAGSTHAGEESLLAEQFLRLKARFPDLFLVLVPRHFERGREVGRELEARGVKFVYRSEMTAKAQYAPGQVQCLLVNTTGELKLFYEQATVIFVGKSLTSTGGQNPIEPAALSKAMVFGPNMQNFAAIVAAFLERKGAAQARDAADLERILGDLLADEAKRDELGRNAAAVVRDNQGAIARTVELILGHLSETHVEKA